MKGLAFAYDPDGYWVEIVPRGGLELSAEDQAALVAFLETLTDPKYANNP